MPPEISSCAANAGFTRPKIRKRSSRRQDTNATREMFIVFFTVKIETPRDANTHDGHVKRRGLPPRGLRCLSGQHRLPTRSSRQSAANRICIPAFRLPKRTFATGPRFHARHGSPSRAEWPLMFPTGKDRWLFGRQATGFRRRYVIADPPIADILRLFK